MREVFDAIKDVYNQNALSLAQMSSGQKYRIDGFFRQIDMRAIITKKQLSNILKIITSFPNP